MTEADEGMNFLGALKERFGPSKRTEARMKAERRASMTTAQRKRKGEPKMQINFRATADTKALIEALAEHFGESVTAVLARAVAELAKNTKGVGGKK